MKDLMEYVMETLNTLDMKIIIQTCLTIWWNLRTEKTPFSVQEIQELLPIMSNQNLSLPGSQVSNDL
jgi:hypothetical protein